MHNDEELEVLKATLAFVLKQLKEIVAILEEKG